MLITRRSQVQILPPLPTCQQVRGPFPLGEGLLHVWPVTRSVTRLLTIDVSELYGALKSWGSREISGPPPHATAPEALKGIHLVRLLQAEAASQGFEIRLHRSLVTLVRRAGRWATRRDRTAN